MITTNSNEFGKDEGSNDSSRESLLGRVANEYSEQVARQQRPSIEDFAKRYPEIADEIRQLFPLLNAFPAIDSLNSKDLARKASSSSPVMPTARVLGDYQLLREIGHGGMGVVYEARQISLDKRVALKILPFANALNAKSLQRFKNEAKAAAQLQHPNIVPVHSFSSERGVYYYAMQYIEGSNLAEVIVDLRKGTLLLPATGQAETTSQSQEPPVDPDATEPMYVGSTEKHSSSSSSSGLLCFKSSDRSKSNADYYRHVVDLAIQAAEALQHAHDSGVVHRDIKPSNLLFDSHGKVWLTDFGLATREGCVGLTGPGDFIGTLRYMSPEQVLGTRVVIDYRTDIYSLGATLYELLTLAAPCYGSTRAEIIRQITLEEPVAPHKLDRRIPRELEIIVAKAMAKNPDERYQSTQALADDLRRHQCNEPIQARRPSMPERVGKWARRHKRLAAGAAIITGIIFLAAVTNAWILGAALAQEIEDKNRIATLLKQSEGLRLATLASLKIPTNPGLAIALAVEGRKRYESPETHGALQQALDANYESATFYAHAEGVGSAAYSPSGQSLVTTGTRSNFGKKAEPAKVWDVATKKQRLTIASEYALTSATFSPNGGRILTASCPFGAENKVGQTEDVVGAAPQLFDSITGQKLVEFKDAYLFQARNECFSPNGRFVVLPGRDGTARVFDVIEGLPHRELVGHTDRVDSAAYSPGGKYIVTTARDMTVRTWDAETGKQILQLPAGQRFGSIVAKFSSDDRWLATSSGNGIQIWQTADGKQQSEIVDLADRALFAESRNRLVLWHGRNLRAFESTTAKHVQTIGNLPTIIADVDVSIDLICVAAGNSIYLYDLLLGQRRAVLNGHERPILTVRFKPAGDQLVSCSLDGTARIWNVRSGAEQSRFGIQLAQNAQTIIESDNKVVAAIREMPRVSVFDLQTRNFSSTYNGRMVPGTTSANRVATIEGDRIYLWDALERRQLASIAFPVGEIVEAEATINGENAVAFGTKGNAWISNMLDNRRIELATTSGVPRTLSISPDQRFVATGYGDGAVHIWNIGGKPVHQLKLSKQVELVQFSPNGDQLLAVFSDDTARTWNSANWELQFDIRNDDIRFNSAVYSRDGNRIITYGVFDNRAIACWNASDGQLLQRFDKPLGHVSVVQHPDLTKILVTSRKTGLFEWNYETGDFLHISETPMACATYSAGASEVIAATASALETDSVALDSTKGYDAPMIQLHSIRAPDKPHESFPLRDGAIRRLRFMNGTLIVSRVTYGAEILDVDDLAKKTTLSSSHASPIAQVAASVKHIATASWDQTGGVWDKSSGQLVHWLDGHDSALTTVAFDSSGEKLLTGSFDGEAILWSVATGKSLHKLNGHTGAIRNVAFLSGSELVLTNSDDGTMRFWNSHGTIAHSITSREGAFLSVQTSSKGEILAIGGNSTPRKPLLSASGNPYPVYLFQSIESKAQQLQLQSHAVLANFDSIGSQVVAVDDANRVYVWKINDQPPHVQFQLDGLGSRVHYACFSPDDRSVLIWHGGKLSSWDAVNGKQTVELTGASTREFGTSCINFLVNSTNKWLIASEDDIHLRRWPMDSLNSGQPFPRSITDKEKVLFHVHQ